MRTLNYLIDFYFSPSVKDSKFEKNRWEISISWCIGADPDKTSTPIEKPSSRVNGVLARSTTWAHNIGVSKKR